MKCNNKIRKRVKFVMPAQWTGELVGRMHLNGITKKQLANALGFTAEYVSMVLNGHREPQDAETRFTEAVNTLISEQDQSITK